MSNLLPDNYKSNVTFDKDVLLDSLTEMKKRSYSYVTSVQKDLVGYHKFEFKMSDFKSNTYSRTVMATTKRYVLNVPKQLIPTANKENYKKSDLFMKELSIKDIADNYKIFPYNFLIFIDGEIYTNLKIVAADDMTRVVLTINNKNNNTGIDDSLYRELVEKDARVTVIFTPNSVYGDFATNKYVVSKYRNQLPIEKFDMYGNQSTSTIAYSIVSNERSGARSTISAGTDLNDSITIGNSLQRILTSSFVNIGVVTLKYFDRIIDIPVGGDYFELPIREHIVPVSSIIALYDEDGVTKYYHDLNITYHYPNIYKVNNNEVPLKLHIFYYKPLDDTPFINELELYYRYLGDKVLKKYKDGTIPESIKNYKPKEFPISIKLFQSSLFNEPLDYEVNTMNENIKLESKNLGIYLKNMLKDRKRMSIDVKNVDLAAKLRTDVSQELPDLDVVFDEERYVFIFSKYFIYDYEMRFFIDGLFYKCDQTYHDDNYYYFYIQKSLINQNSLIEIEKYRSVRYDFDIGFDTDIKDIHIDENSCITSDAFFIDEEGYYLDDAYFSFIIEEDGEEVEVPANSHKKLPDYFKVKTSKYLGSKITVMFRRLSAVYEYKVNNPDDAGKTLLFKTEISRHAGHLRIFRNGRFMPPSLYTVRFKVKKDNYNVVNLGIKKQVGDVYHIEFNPDVYYTAYYSEEIGTDGFVDFTGKLNKPFDLKWFDVYLNGFRLNKNNFEVLTPRYVIIKNVASTSHLTIVEKNWLDDVFKFETSEQDTIPPELILESCTDDEFFNSDQELRDTIFNSISDIVVDDTIDELLPGFIIDTSDEIAKVLDLVFKYLINQDLFINPDLMMEKEDLPYQLSKVIEADGNVVRIFPRGVDDVTTSVILNPDSEIIDADRIPEMGGVVIN